MTDIIEYYLRNQLSKMIYPAGFNTSITYNRLSASRTSRPPKVVDTDDFLSKLYLSIQ